MDQYEEGMEIVSQFCRLNTNSKREIPIRTSEMGLIIYLAKEKGEVTPLMAAAHLKVGKSSITALVNNLCEKGYIWKKPKREDGRSYVLELTRKAEKMVDAALDEYNKTMEYLEIGMGSKKYHQLLELLMQANKILAALKE